MEPPGAHPPLPKERHLVFVILMGVFTFGIYTLIWLYLTYRETHEHLGRSHKAGLALGLGITAMVLTYVALVFYFASFLAIIGSGEDPSLGVLGIGGLLGSLGLMILAALAYAGIQVWMTWGAAHGTEEVLRRYGREPSIPPLVHALVPIVLNVWIYVAMGMVQNDINQLHPQA